MISVVIPSLNDARMLEHCLDALQAQTRQPDEVIVVDNGSTDDTAAVAVAAGARVVVEPKIGVLRATAAGFDAAQGDIVGRLDADSRPARDWIETLEQRFEADPTLSGITGPGIFYGRDAASRFIGQHIYIGGYFWFMKLFLGQVPVFGSNMALRRETWIDARQRIHLDDPHIHDDLDISFALSPDSVVELDKNLVVMVSARPFDSTAGLKRRVVWAFHGMRLYLSEISWWRRRRLRRAALANRRQQVRSASA